MFQSVLYEVFREWVFDPENIIVLELAGQKPSNRSFMENERLTHSMIAEAASTFYRTPRPHASTEGVAGESSGYCFFS